MANLLQVTLALLLVLATIGAAAWLLKSARRTRGATQQLIHIEASVAVGTRERIVLIEVGGQWLLLGVAPGRVSRLAQLPAAALPPDATASAGAHPASWLATYLGKNNAQ